MSDSIHLVIDSVRQSSNHLINAYIHVCRYHLEDEDEDEEEEEEAEEAEE